MYPEFEKLTIINPTKAAHFFIEIFKIIEAVPVTIKKSNMLPFYRIHRNYYLEVILESFKTFSTYLKLNSKNDTEMSC